MKGELAIGFIAAVILHGVVLFGLRLETPAHPLAMSDEPSPMDVSLVAAAEPASAAPAPAEPAATPEPIATPAPTAEPAPEMPTPTPEPEPTPEQETMPAPEATPVARHAKPLPRPAPQHRAGTAMPHSALDTAAALAGTQSHGWPGGAPSSQARYLSNPKPDYPEEARRQRQEGVALVSVEVGTDGRPSEVTLGRSSGFPMLDQAALEAVRRWRFQPAEAGGLAVESRVEVPVRFRLSQ